MIYPRIVTCQITGIKAKVWSAAEERHFHQVGIRALAISMGVGALVLAIALLMVL